MSDTTITSANSVLTLRVPKLFPQGVQMVGYSSDKAFAMETLQLAEVNMGVDGRMTAGYVPNPSVQSITLQADSPSKSFFNGLIQATKAAREVFYIYGDLALPSTGESFTLVRGTLTKGKQVPDAAKVLQPMDYEITWERVDPSLL